MTVAALVSKLRKLASDIEQSMPEQLMWEVIDEQIAFDSGLVVAHGRATNGPDYALDFRALA